MFYNVSSFTRCIITINKAGYTTIMRSLQVKDQKRYIQSYIQTNRHTLLKSHFEWLKGVMTKMSLLRKSLTSMSFYSNVFTKMSLYQNVSFCLFYFVSSHSRFIVRDSSFVILDSLILYSFFPFFVPRSWFTFSEFLFLCSSFFVRHSSFVSPIHLLARIHFVFVPLFVVPRSLQEQVSL